MKNCLFAPPPESTGIPFEIFSDIGDHGTISTDRYSLAGVEVFVEVHPDEGCKLDTLVIERVDGIAVEYWSNEPMVYIFTMPRSDVRITVTFVEDENWEPEEPLM